ncbi:MAG: c-type cytochrome domain-containing protein [Caldilineaceae bacterium]
MLEWLNRFITPERSAPLWKRLAPYAILIFAGLSAFLVGGAGWEYSNSNEFCGSTCHTMPPEYIAYQASPHASVKCVECHIGRATIATQFGRKIQEITHVTSLIGADYEVPIYAKKLRPADQICERCHSAKKFSDSSLVEFKHYDAAQNNQLTSTYLALKTGGGTAQEGQGNGIHWHIENKVEFIATDDPHLDQEIAWARVTYVNGETKVFQDMNVDLPADFVAQNSGRLKKLDCMACHNRVSHLIRTPSDALDDAMARGVVSPEIPYIKQNALAIMERAYPSMEEAQKAVYGLVDYYQVNWPDYYAANAQQIWQVSREIYAIYEGLVFPTMSLSWETHPDNIGHKDWAGCFRCHNGSMVSDDNERIPANCTTCHTLPVKDRPDGSTPTMLVTEQFKPESHTDPVWIARHRYAFDETCAGCHTVTNPGKMDNSSFCANSGCHATEWQYAKFDTPRMLDLVNVLATTAPTYPEAELTWNSLVGPILATRCLACHGEDATDGLNLTTYAEMMKGGNQGAVIVPGQADASLLVQVQRDGHPNQLPPAALDWVTQWIDAGAPESSIDHK